MASHDAWQFSLFSLFFPEIYSQRHLVRRRILASRAIEPRNNSKTLAVLSLFPAVFGL
jgi:hypothetical protein